MTRKSPLGLFGKVITPGIKSAAKAASKAQKEHERRLKAEQTRLRREIYEQEKARLRMTMLKNGYVPVTIKSLEKYIAGACLDDETFNEMELSALNGEKTMFVLKEKMDAIKEKYKSLKQS